jgi:uncharacterized protein with PQ loop repeat
MSNFKDAQNKAHPNKSNTLLSALICILILNISIQIWLLYTGLNNALDKNRDIALPVFVVSLILFLVGVGWLYFLPMGDRKKSRK